MNELKVFKSLIKVAGSFGLFPPLGVLAMTSGGAVTASFLGHLVLFLVVAIVLVVLLIAVGIVCIVRELRHPSWGPLGVRKPAVSLVEAVPAPALTTQSEPILTGVVLAPRRLPVATRPAIER